MSRRTIAYQPALDGTRALAVTAVLLFHGGVSWMSGGYLGVSVFFTLSGYLITSLLLTEHASTGSIAAAAFYTRRARRLLPASLVCIVGVCLMAWAGWFEGVANLRRDVFGAVFQVFNWVKLGSGESYADLTAAQAGLKQPLDHYWSLAIEEQFYWVWPMVFIGLVAVARRRGVKVFTVVAWLTGLSAVAAPVIAQVWGPNAAYWATPARICEILAGALVACWLHGRSVPRGVAPLAPISLGVLTVACVLFPDGHGPAYQGALPLVAAASANAGRPGARVRARAKTPQTVTVLSSAEKKRRRRMARLLARCARCSLPGPSWASARSATACTCITGRSSCSSTARPGTCR